ncbi:YfgM family protein [Aquabacterium sp.]|mgnify:CR=1 FL=1|uniref:YfgM family protein n=1 Tax=Aquabacterium sp. TaxID=1872578 RepID=UPI0035AE6939
MATYDLEQQEQLEDVKHFWKKYGNLITWVLILALAAYAGWTGYRYWQQKRGLAAAGLYEELDRAVQAGDAAKASKAFDDITANYAGTTYAEQGALLAARAQLAASKDDAARAALQWEVEHGKNKDLVAIARLRLAGLLMDAKQYDPALKALEADMPAGFKPLADDRRGDVLMAQGKSAEAIKAYEAAWKDMAPTVEYRRFVEGKLIALGHAPQASAAASN